MSTGGYVPCACRDCMEIGTAGEALCHECEAAGCEGDTECQAPGAYGIDELDIVVVDEPHVRKMGHDR